MLSMLCLGATDAEGVPHLLSEVVRALQSRMDTEKVCGEILSAFLADHVKLRKLIRDDELLEALDDLTTPEVLGKRG